MKLSFDTNGNLVQIVNCSIDLPGYINAPDWYRPEIAVFQDVESGEIIPYSLEQLAKKDIRPAWPAFWSNVTMKWEDSRSLDELKFDQRQIIKQKRNTHIQSPKQTSIGLFDADEASQNNLNKVIALVKLAVEKGGPAEANYTLATNERRMFTLEELETAALEIGFQVQEMFDIADELYTQIEAATTKEQIAAVQWPSM